MCENTIELKSIHEILNEGYKFFIPRYQRGYRWSVTQVKVLLDDIWEFSLNAKSREEFYCLQPVVVKDIGDKLEVIDGQQRLTTIYLILLYLESLLKENDLVNFILEYETRLDSEKFLASIDTEKRDENIDYFHICQALDTISNWFKNKEGAAKSNFLIALSNPNERGRNVKFIWYQIRDASNPIDIFTRINLGKIPLTNAELIKALLLRSGNFGDDPEWTKLKQLEISREWDTIEQSLQNDDFWYFLKERGEQEHTRIDLIFDLMAEEINSLETRENRILKVRNDYYSFMVFNQWFEEEVIQDSEKVIDRVWKKIKRYYMTFEEWFYERDLYHWIGYLRNFDKGIEEIIINSKEKSKSEFKDYLKEEIRSFVNYDEIRKLNYDKPADKKALERILLLLNIESILMNSKESSRYPFSKHKKQKWSIEHVHAQNSKGLNSDESRIEWLKDISASISNMDENSKDKRINNLLKKINRHIESGRIAKDKFEILQAEIFNAFGNPHLDSIENLTLLSLSDNISISNSIFPVKRRKIIELDAKGSFIPICTRNLFLKYYSKNVSHLYYWGERDQQDYVKAIFDILQEYLPVQTEED